MKSRDAEKIRTSPRRMRLAVLALLAAADGVAVAQPAPSVPVAIEAHRESVGRETRLSFALSACVATDSYLLDSPARAIVDLGEVNFQIDPGVGLAPQAGHGRHARKPDETGLISSFRFGKLAPGKSRIVVDLSGPAEIISASCVSKSDGGGADLTLALAPQPDAGFKNAARAGAEMQAHRPGLDSIPPPVAPAAPAKSQKPVIVLDPGHGGIDAGALGRNHAVEKSIVLDFARALGAKLREGDRFKVVFTREDDTFVPLGERVRMARNLGAALFVSLHADTLAGDGEDVQGATVYTVSDRASDREAARIAEHENKADSAAGEEAKEDASDVNDILFDLTRRETRAYSHVFAHSLAEYWKVAARLNKNPRRSAGFVVLKAPDVPSVLLELGYLSNDADVAELTSPEWRDKASAQVARAIDAFFASRRPADANPTGAAAPAPAAAFGALKGTQSPGN
jgi:N-acetylmuramoyl-L-alanine amidase